MRKGGRLLILLGVVLALMAAVLAVIAFRGDSDDSEDAEDQVATVEVVQTTRDIPANHVLTQDDIDVVEVDETTVAAGTARSSGQVIGLAVSGELVEGQRILVGNLETPGLSHLVEDGLRAVAVPIDRVNALGGLVRSEDRIDIVYSGRIATSLVLPTQPFEAQDSSGGISDTEFTVPPPGEESDTYVFAGEPGSRFIVSDVDDGDPITKMLLQNVRVVRVIAGDITVEDQLPPEEEATAEAEEEELLDEPGERLPSSDLLILEVTAEQSELLKFIIDNDGRFHVALRATDDNEIIETPGLTFNQMVTELGLPVPRTVTLP